MPNIVHVFYQHDMPKEVIAEDEHHQFEFHLNRIDNDQDFKIIHQQSCDMVMLYNLDKAIETSLIHKIQSLKHLPLVIISKIFNLQRKLELVKQGIDEFFHIEEDITYIKFKLKNLLQRIQLIKHLQSGTIEFQHLKVHFSSRQVYDKNKRINVTVKEFELLQLFLSNPNITLSKEEIFYHLWNKDVYFSENIINVHIRHLRKKIELNDKKPLVIETVWGYGYKLGQGEVIQNQ
jgi:two-component system, OmpR family, alkaline phosphatase synthesis response regulator PhoP